ncbi:uncharacterized protein [Aegilops tauschii subsp. strangulata]|uniref:uncharacterized protein n=1 Tax=Aegilops tauschii subsp. strangulata TaxID=200361 RepID=UPI003CC8539D
MIKHGLEAKDMEPTRTIFHDIVPGLSGSPIGRIQLNVLFGDSNHFRREPIWFEVVDLSNVYHALLGRPALAKFMAIKLDPADSLKTSFITPFGAYCYMTMSFSLKNAGTTFQRCMQKCLLPQLCGNINVYVDDIMADEAFRDLKRMLSTAPVLAAPAEKEPLLLYIAATSRSVSTFMVVERTEKGKIQAVQRPVYYLSEVLSSSKQNYPHYQKMCYGVYFTANKLKKYFQEHVLTVVSMAPLGEIIGFRDASGWVGKWALELAGHTILYEPRTTIKSQALAKFLVDWTKTQYKNEAADTLAKIASSQQSIPPGVSLEHLHKPSVKPSPDSESIYVPDNPAASQPGPGTAEPGPRTEAVDPAAVVLNPAAAIPDPGAAHPGSGAAALEPALVAVFAVVTAPSLALSISEFLENGVLPMDETEARQVQRRASAYNIINNELVKRSSTGVFQCCIEHDQGIEILLDIHQGECGHHAASRSLVAKAFRHGLYWPTTLQDAESLVLKCEGCQRFSKRSHQLASAL